MRLKFEKNKIHCRVSQIEAVELMRGATLTDSVNFPSGHIFTFSAEMTELDENVVHYAHNRLSFKLTKQSLSGLIEQPSKNGVIFLQDGAAYAFEVDIRKERRKKLRKS